MYIQSNCEEIINILRALCYEKSLLSSINEIVNVIIQSYKSGGKLYITANGGFAADSQNLAAEFISKLSRDRVTLTAEALTTDTSFIIVISNDYGFESIFSSEIIGKVKDIAFSLGLAHLGCQKI